MKTAKGELMIIGMLLALAACTKDGSPSVAPAPIPTQDSAGSAPTATCNTVAEKETVKWNGKEVLTTVMLCSDQCLHFARPSTGWTPETVTNCTASTWPSTTWNGDAYEHPDAPKNCYSWFCQE